MLYYRVAATPVIHNGLPQPLPEERHRLEDIVGQARENERKLRRFQNFELRLFSHDSLFALIKDVLYPASLFPEPGPHLRLRHAALFPVRKKAPASIMLLPLVRDGRLIGSLNIGSNDTERFSLEARTDFFEHFPAGNLSARYTPSSCRYCGCGRTPGLRFPLTLAPEPG